MFVLFCDRTDLLKWLMWRSNGFASNSASNLATHLQRQTGRLEKHLVLTLSAKRKPTNRSSISRTDGCRWRRRVFLTTFDRNHDRKCDKSLTMKASYIRSLFHQDIQWMENSIAKSWGKWGQNVQTSGATTPGPSIMKTLRLMHCSLCSSFWFLQRWQSSSPSLPTHWILPPVILSYSWRSYWSWKGEVSRAPKRSRPNCRTWWWHWHKMTSSSASDHENHTGISVWMQKGATSKGMGAIRNSGKWFKLWQRNFGEHLGGTSYTWLSEVHTKFNGHANQDENWTQTLSRNRYGTSVDKQTNTNFYPTTRILWNVIDKLVTQHWCVMQECTHLNSPWEICGRMPKVVDDFHDRNHLTFLPEVTAITFWRCVNIWRYICGNTGTETENGIWIKTDQLDVTCFFISLFNAQHVSDVSTSILRSLWLICGVISWDLLLWYDGCWCYVMVWLWWCGIRMQAEAVLQDLATYLWSYFMGCIALVRWVLVLRCGLAVVVWYPDAGWSLY